MSFTNVIVALDLSLSSPGFAAMATTDEGKPILLEKSHVKTNAKKSHGYRLDTIMDEIYRYLGEYAPENIAREKGFSRFPATTQTLFKVVGISDYAANDHGFAKVEEIPPTTVKKLVAGSGKASKEDVEKAVRSWLQLDDSFTFATDDESDAAAVGLAYYISKGLIE